MSSLIRERPVLKPAQLNALARDLLEGSFAQVWVEGEISNFVRAVSGHLYFVLKDDRAQVRCAMFRQKAMYLRFSPRDGMQILVRGRLTLYEARGEYQLSVEHIEEAGEGALRRAFEELKLKLTAEGLFDVSRKRPMPRFIRRLGIITSPRGAAVRDVISVLTRRWPLLEVDILPVPVQGATAAGDIRAMLEHAAASGRYDVLLLTRGGGSLEDLWSFNDEALARAIANCTIPVVSAVGHEIDFSLADFAADLRAPTPSAAAELIVPEHNELTARLDQAKHRFTSSLQRKRDTLAQRADQAWLRLQSLRPQLRIERGAHRLAMLRNRLNIAIATSMSKNVDRLRQQGSHLEQHNPRQRIMQERHKSNLLFQRLGSNIVRDLERRTMTLRELARTLHSTSPLATLSRGYTILRDPLTGVVVRRTTDARPGNELDAQLSDGIIRVIVKQDRD